MTVAMVAERTRPVNVQPLEPKFQAMAQYLKQRAVRDLRWGMAFIRALDKGVAYHQQNKQVKRLSRGYWSAPSASRIGITHLCNRWVCDCEAYQQGEGQWCWHRAIVLLHEVETEFDHVHGLAMCDGDEDRTPDCQPSYRLIIELAG